MNRTGRIDWNAFTNFSKTQEERTKNYEIYSCALNALAIDNPLEYATLYLEDGMQTWVDAVDSLESW